MKLLAVVSIGLLLAHVANAREYVYTFGVDYGSVINTEKGSIPLLRYHTEVHIPVPFGIQVTYVEVTVEAVSAPSVEYDPTNYNVIIDYNWTQITASSYKIVTKGVLGH